jgi:type IV secretion system protein TrbC
MNRHIPIVPILVLLLIFFVCGSEQAHASTHGGGLPYEAWLKKLQDSMTGPVARGLSLIGIVVAGGMLIFGGELNAFARTAIFIVLVMALLVGANSFMNNFSKGSLVLNKPQITDGFRT